MANEAQDTSASVMTHGSKSSGKLPTYLSAIALAVALAAGGFSAYETMVLEDQQTLKIGKYVQKKVGELKTELNSTPAIDEEAMAVIEESIANQVVAQVEAIFNQESPEIIARIKNDAIISVEQNMPQPKAVQPVNVDKIVYAVVNKLRTSPNINIPATDKYARGKIDNLEGEVSRLEQAVSSVEKMATAPRTNIKVGQAVTPPARLKEFNIIAPMENGKFAINAPSKQGQPNLVTLEVGEPFKSKVGSHKVLSIQKAKNGKTRLLISGNYYIDSEREEFTEQELAAFKAKKATTKKSAPSPKKHTTTSFSPTAIANKVELKDWFVITPKPKSKEVIVYNPQTQTPMRLSKNSYVSGVGTVRDIDYKTGTTQFEKYYIRGTK